jgi:hypothetical protein
MPICAICGNVVEKVTKRPHPAQGPVWDEAEQPDNGAIMLRLQWRVERR